MTGHWMIRRVETVLGTPITIASNWNGNYSSKEEAMQAATAAAKCFTQIGNIAVKWEIQYMK